MNLVPNSFVYPKDIKYVQRYVIVRYDSTIEGFALFRANWAQFHYDDAARALEACEAYRESARVKLGFEDMRVIKARCYENGDCTGTIFTNEFVAENEVKDS